MSNPACPREAGLPSIDAGTVQRFRIALAPFGLSGAHRLLVAVSGGADSLALLLLAHAAMGDRLHAATVDHGLRDEAGDEAARVGDVCRQLDVPHVVLAGTMPSRSGRTANLSSRSRELRYRLLEEHRLATGCAHVATAHHADDQVETLVMRLNRGAGIAGLAGVRAVSGTVIRPLLTWRRQELAAVVSAAGLAPALDPSNRDDRFDRARLRKALAGVDWLNVGRWVRSATALAAAEEALAWTTSRLGRKSIAEDSDGVVLRLGDEPAEIARRLVAECLRRVDPAASVRGDDLLRRTQRMLATAPDGGSLKSTLAGVVVSARSERGSIVARFQPAPPRRQVAQP